MKNHTFYISFTLWMIALAICFMPVLGFAQEADTIRRELNLEGKESINLPKHFDRSYSGGTMSEMGTYDVPTQTKYYKAPFKGQYYLDLAVEAYREELEKQVGDGWFWNFLKVVSPFIKNRFEFSVYRIEDMSPPVDRDNPLFQSDR